MRAVIAFLLLWLGLILESTLFQIPPVNVIHPGFVLVMLVLIALFRGPKTAVVFAVIIGLIQDICYGSFIGLNAFSYGLIAYFAGAVFSQFLHRNLTITFMTAMVLTFLNTWVTFGLTRLFDVTADSPSYVLAQSLVTMLVNGLLVLMLYPIMTRVLLSQKRPLYESTND